MSLYDFDCCVCEKPLPSSHEEWHTDEETGGDCHVECCSRCNPRVHPGQVVFDFAKPHPDPAALRLAQTPRRSA